VKQLKAQLEAANAAAANAAVETGAGADRRQGLHATSHPPPAVACRCDALLYLSLSLPLPPSLPASLPPSLPISLPLLLPPPPSLLSLPTYLPPSPSLPPSLIPLPLPPSLAPSHYLFPLPCPPQERDTPPISCSCNIGIGSLLLFLSFLSCAPFA
jgi:hypothetical protein